MPTMRLLLPAALAVALLTGAAEALANSPVLYCTEQVDVGLKDSTSGYKATSFVLMRFTLAPTDDWGSATMSYTADGAPLTTHYECQMAFPLSFPTSNVMRCVYGADMLNINVQTLRFVLSSGLGNLFGPAPGYGDSVNSAMGNCTKF